MTTSFPMYGAHPAHLAGHPGGPHIYDSYQNQPAPRQRTAIACRYCRRRKIRCSGFETSPDGRCANCMRFNQECVFTPVSSATQAFVPAHVVAGPEGPTVLYGPHGTPLPPGYQQHSGAPPYAHPNPERLVRRSSNDEYPSEPQPPSPSSHLQHHPGPYGQDELPPALMPPHGYPDPPPLHYAAGYPPPYPNHPQLHPPLVRPRSTDPRDPPPPLNLCEPPRPRPNHHSADGDMLSRLNSRTGL
ncbi:hypothetical protein EX30DRAFT_185800 [Ascodesmis nigricans]|uniref:Zn(2)-C6 fungal-type domain-containing protein n=1 Tax=Ascodesmis nigricans TaxID=341454 RepID=A0A4S2N037_9PEZI|nr:hypothetical protein EX30DRAFT_185800 [Ascodesmis nigricans]